MCKNCEAEGVLLGEMERVILENTEPGHHKQYTVWIEEYQGGYRVVARWGPIGKWTKSQVKSPLYESMRDARRVLDEIRNDKVGRGYVERVCA
jgi:predicted DNA-binding WGR domain protein